MDQNNEFPEEAVKKLWKLGRKGFEFGDNYDKMGIRSSSTAELMRSAWQYSVWISCV